MQMSHGTRKDVCKPTCWIPGHQKATNTGSLTVVVDADAGLEFQAQIQTTDLVATADIKTQAQTLKLSVPEPVPGIGRYTFLALRAATYEVSLRAPNGYIVDNDSQTAEVVVGQNTLVNFKSALSGTLKISLSTDPATGDETFTFTIAPAAAGRTHIALTTSGDGKASYSINNVFPGAYEVTRTLDEKWMGDYDRVVEVPNDNEAIFDLTQAARLMITKIISNYNNNDDTFGFTIPGVNGTTMVTTSGGAGLALVTVPYNIKSVHEIPVPGWVVQADQTVQLPPGGSAPVGFTNTEYATLTINKITFGGDGEFNFVLAGPTHLDPITVGTSGGSGTSSTYKILPGSYTLSENTKSGWQTPVSEDFTAKSGEAYSFDVQNTKLGSVSVHKTTVPPSANDTFAFTLDGVAFNITTAGGTGEATFTDVTPGQHILTETQLSGWFTAQPPAVNVAPGANTAVNVTNYKYAKITVLKTITNYDGNKVKDDTFDFTGDLGAFSITTVGGTGAYILDEIGPGTYTVTETSKAGWAGSGSKSITLDWGDDKTLEFRNTAVGILSVTKTSYNGTGTFDFRCTGPESGSFSMTTTTPGTAVITYLTLAVGTYIVTEIVPEGWSVNTNGSSVVVSHNMNSTAPFINYKLPAITIRKYTTAGDGTFIINYFMEGGVSDNVSITTTGGTGEHTVYVEPGKYTITESEQTGWMLESINQTPISLNYGDPPVIVEVTNRPVSTLTVHKNVIGDTSERTFSFSVSPAVQGISSFNIVTKDGIGSYEIADVPIDATTYEFTETSLLTGWTQDGPHSLTPSYGATNAVTFNNYAPGVIQISFPVDPGFTEGFSFTVTVLKDGIVIFTTLVTATFANGGITLDVATPVLRDLEAGVYDIQVSVTGPAVADITPSPPVTVAAGQMQPVSIHFRPA